MNLKTYAMQKMLCKKWFMVLFCGTIWNDPLLERGLPKSCIPEEWRDRWTIPYNALCSYTFAYTDNNLKRLPTSSGSMCIYVTCWHEEYTKRLRVTIYYQLCTLHKRVEKKKERMDIGRGPRSHVHRSAWRNGQLLWVRDSITVL